jgi:hypothetical protein
METGRGYSSTDRPIQKAGAVPRLKITAMTLQPAARDGIYGYRARIGYASPPLMTEVFPTNSTRSSPTG